MAEQNFANHYQSSDEATRTTWRRTRQQATQQHRFGANKSIMKRPVSAHQSISIPENNQYDCQQQCSSKIQSSSSACLSQMALSLKQSDSFGKILF